MPVLGRMPGVGRLFSNRENVKTNTETIVLIKPTILTADSIAVDKDTIEYIDRIQQQQDIDVDALNEEMSTFFK